MKIYYIANIRIPTEKAHGVQIMKMCEAFMNEGVDVELIIPGRKTDIKEDPFEYYNVARDFEITIRRVPDLVKRGRVGFIIGALLFGIRAAWYVRKTNSICFSRDSHVAWVLSVFKLPFIYEVHKGEWNLFVRRAMSHAVGLIANSAGTKEFYIKRGVPEDNILVAQNGVDIEKFNISLTKEEAREKLGLPRGRQIVMYTGHLYDWKGVDVLADAADQLPHEILVVFVGGTKGDVEKFREKYRTKKNISTLGHQPNAIIPLYLKAADVLVIPNIKKGESEHFTSPIKLFEYMASGTPIIASDLSSIREIVDNRGVLFASSGNSKELAKKIKDALANSQETLNRAQTALVVVKNYTWNNRARKILNLVKNTYEK